MKTTLKKIKANDPCEPGWNKLLAALGKTEADDEPIELSFILESNGYKDALWALRSVDGYEEEILVFSNVCMCEIWNNIDNHRVGRAWASAWAASIDSLQLKSLYTFVHPLVSAQINLVRESMKNFKSANDEFAIKTAIHDEFKKLISL